MTTVTTFSRTTTEDTCKSCAIEVIGHILTSEHEKENTQEFHRWLLWGSHVPGADARVEVFARVLILSQGEIFFSVSFTAQDLQTKSFCCKLSQAYRPGISPGGAIYRAEVHLVVVDGIGDVRKDLIQRSLGADHRSRLIAADVRGWGSTAHDESTISKLATLDKYLKLCFWIVTDLIVLFLKLKFRHLHVALVLQ